MEPVRRRGRGAASPVRNSIFFNGLARRKSGGARHGSRLGGELAEALLRPLDQPNPDPAAAALERELLELVMTLPLSGLETWTRFLRLTRWQAENSQP